VVTGALFESAFASVRCFFAAALSPYLATPFTDSPALADQRFGTAPRCPVAVELLVLSNIPTHQGGPLWPK
jgi:hypothetical protein